MGTLVREHGVNSFKHFMAYKNAIMADDENAGEQLHAARSSWARSAPCMPRTASSSSSCSRRCSKRGITGPEGHPLSRPPEVEGEAANRAIRIAEVLGAPLYIVHVLAAASRSRRSPARALEGQRVYGEVLAGHLLIDESVYRNPDWNAPRRT